MAVVLTCVVCFCSYLGPVVCVRMCPAGVMKFSCVLYSLAGCQERIHYVFTFSGTVYLVARDVCGLTRAPNKSYDSTTKVKQEPKRTVSTPEQLRIIRTQPRSA